MLVLLFVIETIVQGASILLGEHHVWVMCTPGKHTWMSYTVWTAKAKKLKMSEKLFKEVVLEIL